ncbi:hypothetical protein [Clostridium sp. YIM B02555]|uniref:hypothetical protein n=1 Tax=Clostridium sp. YIM B02555 TaxID=2911968 RepID=UPI001EEDDB54|nr:hypothetical protein [Clostridium sp. YIM B02555]
MAVKKMKSNETMYNAVALKFIKYNGERIAPGKEFFAKESDVEELKAKECAEIKDAIENEDDKKSGDGGQVNDNPDNKNTNGTGTEGEGA